MKKHLKAPNKECRESIRHRVDINTRSHIWEQGVDESIVNISKTGCKLKTNFTYKMGELIILTVKGKPYIGKKLLEKTELVMVWNS
jgi:hypothetical protein